VIDISLIGAGRPFRCNPLIAVYLKWDRYSAQADALLRTYGMEVPLSFSVPKVRELPPIKWSVCDWPERVVVEL
jgi:hypothetical protein